MVEKELLIEPVTRVEGHVGVNVKVDMDKKVYTNAHTIGTMISGFEVIMRGREPADAIWLYQRVCGVCPAPHSYASTIAVEMAYNAPPPPMGIAIRDLVDLAEMLYDSPLGCCILQGADYSQLMIEKLNPSWWEAAKVKEAEHSAYHGFKTIADIMIALNPITGQLWQQAVVHGKLGRKMAATFGAKHPHINTFVPGGTSYTLSATDVESYAAMLAKHVAFSKEFVPAMDDLLNFFVAMGYDKAGARQANLIAWGCYDDPTAYDASYKNMTSWGHKRKVTPGIVISGKLITTDLVEMNLGVREYITRSYYNDWGQDVAKDPLGNDLAKEHPWNKDTIPAPGPAKNWAGKYSWSTSPRWHDWKKRVDGGTHVVEAGPISRMWTTAMAKIVPEATGNSLRFTLPKVVLLGYRNADEMSFEWKIPSGPSIIERIRARAYFHAYSAYVAYNLVVAGLGLVKQGVTKTWNRYEKPKDGIGFGSNEAFRGALGHWVVMRNGVIHRYQCITPSNWNICPRDKDNRPGPCEQSVIGTPMTEAGQSEIKGLDAVRVLRSFDLCLGCTVNVFDGKRVIKRTLDPRF